jgi:serine/threonine protein kinase
MAENLPDETLAEALAHAGVVTPQQLQAARQEQSENTQQGQPVHLGVILVRQGAITPVILKNVTKHLHAQKQKDAPHLGQYKLIRKIGGGGMGQVFLAEDLALSRQVAVKQLDPQLVAKKDSLKRFKREATAAGKLNHPNIVSAFTVEEDAGAHFLVMEYCDGETLDKMVKRLTFLPEEKALAVGEGVCRGLQCAHTQAIIHRDIKPGNIAVTKDETVKILDLGLVKNIEADSGTWQTTSGKMMGTPHYISPEQARGEKTIDGRADIYSLGATLYYLVEGRASTIQSARVEGRASMMRSAPGVTAPFRPGGRTMRNRRRRDAFLLRCWSAPC